MIPKSTSYALTVDGEVVAVGGKTEMLRLRKKTANSKLWLSPGAKIGDKIG
jgi:hypothetical protein